MPIPYVVRERARVTTTFHELRKGGACVTRYCYLAKALGGVRKYGAHTPINLLTILDICGPFDASYTIRWILCRPMILVGQLNKLYDTPRQKGTDLRGSLEKEIEKLLRDFLE